MWDRLSPQQKKVAMALGGAGILALFVMLSRGRSAPAASSVAEPAGDAASAYDWSSVPSIGGDGMTAASDLSWIGEGFGDIQSTLTDIGGRLTAIESAGNTAPQVDVGALQTAIDASVISAVGAAIAPTKATTSPPAATRNPKTTGENARARGAVVQRDTSGFRKGLRYTTTTNRRGVEVRHYESVAGRGDFGAVKGSRMVDAKPGRRGGFGDPTPSKPRGGRKSDPPRKPNRGAKKR